MKRVSGVVVALLVLIVFPWPGGAAQHRPWVMLGECRYVTARDNDGDSVRVRCGEQEFTLRLYFVDAPETNLRYPERTREQSEHFGVTLDETLRAGAKARDAVREILRDPFVVRTRWAVAAGRARETRYYALVEAGGTSLAETLVGRGLARTKGVYPNLPTGEKAGAYVKKLEALEGEARGKGLGIWAGSSRKKAAPETK
jgi:endonuclease YncB( thermonuclease family)